MTHKTLIYPFFSLSLFLTFLICPCFFVSPSLFNSFLCFLNLSLFRHAFLGDAQPLRNLRGWCKFDYTVFRFTPTLTDLHKSMNVKNVSIIYQNKRVADGTHHGVNPEWDVVLYAESTDCNTCRYHCISLQRVLAGVCVLSPNAFLYENRCCYQPNVRHSPFWVANGCVLFYWLQLTYQKL